jgi:hypothetical protein
MTGTGTGMPGYMIKRSFGSIAIFLMLYRVIEMMGASYRLSWWHDDG